VNEHAAAALVYAIWALILTLIVIHNYKQERQFAAAFGEFLIVVTLTMSFIVMLNGGLLSP